MLGLASNWDADTFLKELKKRQVTFSLSLYEDKTRLIQFGRYARKDWHIPVIQQVKWLKHVVQGHRNYFAVPGNGRLLSLADKSANDLVQGLEAAHPEELSNWVKFGLFTNALLPKARILHPWPSGLASNTQGRSFIH